MRRRCFIQVAVLVLATAGTPALAQPLVTDEQVAAAIEKIKSYLYAMQGVSPGRPYVWAENAWDPKEPVGGDHQFGGQYGGTTALVSLALLVAGDSPQKPELGRAIFWLQTIPDAHIQGVYARGLRANVWAQLPDHYLDELNVDGQWLLMAAGRHPRGLFNYTPTDADGVDHSVTQYGMLGLWAYARRGGNVPAVVWERIAKHMLEHQNADGGWGYSLHARNTTGSMTAAGLANLYIVREQLDRHLNRPRPELSASINRALTWFDRHFVPHTNPGGPQHTLYYLYGVERVGLASGISSFNNRDWYEQGARAILERIDETGRVNNVVDSAFALMFLARGRYPVWIAKLQVNGARWQNRPMDLAQLTAYLSAYREAEMNWIVIDADSDPLSWTSVPLLYLASDEPIILTDEQKQSLKTYLDLGGTLVCTPDEGSPRFARSIHELAAELYPQYDMAAIPHDDPLMRVQQPIEEGGQEVLGLSNGARWLIVMSTRDWSFDFQTDPRPGTGLPWKVMINLWAMTTNRGTLPTRLEYRYEPRVERASAGRAVVARVQHLGNWDPEPGAWRTMADRLWNQAGIELETLTVTLDALGECDAPLAHLAGIGPIVLSADDMDAIDRYVERGGTLLVETVAGREGFTASIENQLNERLGTSALRVPYTHPIINGDGLPAGYDCRRVTYRRYAVVQMGVANRPRLAAYFVHDRPAILVTGEDLSLGAIGALHWNTLGYDPKSARRLLTNIVLYTHRQHATAAATPDAQVHVEPTP